MIRNFEGDLLGPVRFFVASNSVSRILSETNYGYVIEICMANDNSIEEEIKERIVLSTKAYYANLKFFKSNLVPKNSKLKLYRSVIRPIVTYVLETWVLKEYHTTDRNSKISWPPFQQTHHLERTCNKNKETLGPQN
jgi:predicted DNA-binding protein YlxM (UPF0122 family)